MKYSRFCYNQDAKVQVACDVISVCKKEWSSNLMWAVYRTMLSWVNVNMNVLAVDLCYAPCKLQHWTEGE